MESTPSAKPSLLAKQGMREKSRDLDPGGRPGGEAEDTGTITRPPDHGTPKAPPCENNWDSWAKEGPGRDSRISQCSRGCPVKYRPIGGCPASMLSKWEPRKERKASGFPS